MAVAAHPHPVEHTTALAVSEKKKLQKAFRRFDMLFFTICAFVGLDTLGIVAASGGEAFTWLIVLAFAFVLPYALLMSEVGSAFTQEGGPYEWSKLAFGRFSSAIAAVYYWITNPLWVGGSLAFIATAAWVTSEHLPDIGTGTPGDYAFKIAFVWFSIITAIISLRYGKWIPTAGAFARIGVLGFFTITTIIYAGKHGVHGIAASDLKPSSALFLALVPLLLFNYVGFELQNGAAEEMVNPQRDVPIAVIRSGIAGVVMYAIPLFCILLVLPDDKITGLGGFADAMGEVFTVYGAAGSWLFMITALGFILTLMTSGAVWMIGSDRVQAVAAYDGAAPGFFGVFNKRLGTPVRVNLLSGVVATIFAIFAIRLLENESTAAAFTAVLYIAISTTLISYLWIFPAALVLRRKYGDVHRPYQIPFGDKGMWVAATLCTLWVAFGSWVAIFPGTIERWAGIPYDFHDTWGLSRARFEAFTLGTLAIITVVAVVGYILGAPVRRQQVDIELDTDDVELAAAPAEA